MDEMPVEGWRTSSRSQGAGGNCVEVGRVADGSGRTAIRHSHRPRAEMLICSARGWRAFVERVRRDSFGPTES